MSPFGDCALETGVKGIAGEEGQDVGKSGKPRVRAIVVDHRLESGDTANGFSGTSSGTRSVIVEISCRGWVKHTPHGTHRCSESDANQACLFCWRSA
jgi:hypothetical protein